MNARDKAFADQIALTFMGVCVVDLSRQIATGVMPLIDSERAIERIAQLSYIAADAMLCEREALPKRKPERKRK